MGLVRKIAQFVRSVFQRSELQTPFKLYSAADRMLRMTFT
jgi:hypothetical protein